MLNICTSSFSRYNSLVTSQRARGIIAICWALSIIIGLIPMMGWHKVYNSTKSTNSTCQPGLMKCLFEEVVNMEYMVYFNFFACVLIPLLLMLAIYLCIFMAARHQLKLIEVKAFHGEKSRSTLQKEVQAAKSLAVIVGLFAVCWLPLHIINCFTLFCPKCHHPPAWIMYVAIILSHANSVINPFIYAYRIREFRQTFRKIIRRHILGRHQVFESSNSEHSSTHNTITDSIRLKANGLKFDFFTEPSRSSSCKNSSSRPVHISPVEDGLVAVSHPPLSVVISNCPHAGTFALQALRQTEIPQTSHLCFEERELDCAGTEIPEEKGKQNLSSTQVSPLFTNQNRKNCFCELQRVS
ncbi:Adenosine receptor A2a [Ilyodon furcidens]|uniref:Adenosine receptor A2 n=1 Tax=Ilyodon furcidens TaxID=33524 RepID=A0ABV0UYK5_9TELE